MPMPPSNSRDDHDRPPGGEANLRRGSCGLPSASRVVPQVDGDRGPVIEDGQDRADLDRRMLGEVVGQRPVDQARETLQFHLALELGGEDGVDPDPAGVFLDEDGDPTHLRLAALAHGDAPLLGVVQRTRETRRPRRVTASYPIKSMARRRPPPSSPLLPSPAGSAKSRTPAGSFRRGTGSA